VTQQQKLVPIGVLLIMALAVGWAFLPFNFANVVDCSAPFFGAEPQNAAPPTSFIDPEKDCLAKGKSRLSVSAVAAFVAALAGVAMIALKPISSSCSSGDHESCREWWLAPLGAAAAGLGCQCDCHDVIW
jgi:hypothetical protein